MYVLDKYPLQASACPLPPLVVSKKVPQPTRTGLELRPDHQFCCGPNQRDPNTTPENPAWLLRLLFDTLFLPTTQALCQSCCLKKQHFISPDWVTPLPSQLSAVPVSSELPPFTQHGGGLCAIILKAFSNVAVPVIKQYHAPQ